MPRICKFVNISSLAAPPRLPTSFAQPRFVLLVHFKVSLCRRRKSFHLLLRYKNDILLQILGEGIRNFSFILHIYLSFYWEYLWRSRFLWLLLAVWNHTLYSYHIISHSWFMAVLPILKNVKRRNSCLFALSVGSKVGKASNSSDRRAATGRFYKCLHEQLILHHTAVVCAQPFS